MGIIELILNPIPIYVRIFENRLILKRIGSDAPAITVTPPKPFSTQRLLIGEFTMAMETLARGFKEIGKGRPWTYARVLIHPKEKIDGGLSEVETRLFLEVAEQSGATQAVIWTGDDLSDEDALRKLDAARAQSPSRG